MPHEELQANQLILFQVQVLKPLAWMVCTRLGDGIRSEDQPGTFQGGWRVCPVSMTKEKMSSSKERAFPFVTHLRLSRCGHVCVRECVFGGDNDRREEFGSAARCVSLNHSKLRDGALNKALKGKVRPVSGCPDEEGHKTHLRCEPLDVQPSTVRFI